MSIDPRAPVLVGAGQLKQKVTAEFALDPAAQTEPKLLEPLDTMEQVARIAAEDAGCPALLSQLDSIRVPRGLWPYANPAHTLAVRFGVPEAQTALAPISGNMVQRMLTDGAREIAAGRRDAVLIVGAEAEHTKRRAKRGNSKLRWSEPEAPAPDLDFDSQETWIKPEEIEAGLAHPATIFSLYENARRHARREGLEDNRERVARLWHRFAKVAERNPYAWTQEAPSVEAIRDDTPDNRMNAYPYTKRLSSNLVVDLGAAVILCSAELAERMGVPQDRWVFLHTATDCMTTPLLSDRMDYLRVPSLELAGRRALELSGLSPNEIAHVDLYSCFPAAVQVAAEALGLPEDRPLTLTGGLAYAGGPFNSYVLHAIATAMERLREDRGSFALVSSVGGSFSKHAFGIYSTVPPRAGFQYADLDAEAAELPQRECVVDFEGDATIETYALRYRDGVASQASVSCLLDDGRRTWIRTVEPTVLQQLLAKEACGRRVRIKAGELIGL